MLGEFLSVMLGELVRDLSYRRAAKKTPPELQLPYDDPHEREEFVRRLKKALLGGRAMDLAVPVLIRMMLSEDLGDRRIGRKLARQFFPHLLEQVKYNWLLPSRDARQYLLRELEKTSS